MQLHKNLFEAVENQQIDLKIGHVPVDLALEFARQALRRSSGCPDEEVLSGFVDDQLRRKSFWTWFKVWLHVYMRNCVYCRADIKDLLVEENQPNSGDLSTLPENGKTSQPDKSAHSILNHYSVPEWSESIDLLYRYVNLFQESIGHRKIKHKLTKFLTPSVPVIFTSANATYKIVDTLSSNTYCNTLKAKIVDVMDGKDLHNGAYVVIKSPYIDISQNFDDVFVYSTKVYLIFLLEFLSMRRIRGVSCAAQILDYGIYHVEIKNGTSAQEIIPSIFSVQEFIEGVTLHEYMSKIYPSKEGNQLFTGIYDAETWFKWAKKLGVSLSKVHECDVVHGDIRPHNIIVRSDGEPVFIDFGQSIFMDVAFDALDENFYKYSYCAPERRNTRRRWHVGADIYSLGGVFFYLATGNDPIETTSDIDELKSAIATAIKSTNPNLYQENTGIVDVIARCMRFKDRDRAPHVEAVLQDLETFASTSHCADLPTDRTARDLAYELIGGIEDLCSTGSPLFCELVAYNLHILRRKIDKMQNGFFELSGDHEDIVLELSHFLSSLTWGDQYLTSSITSFWHPHNLGINGRFLTMNKLAAQHGSLIRRVFLITEEDENSDPYLEKIIIAHQHMLHELAEIGVETNDRRLEGRGFFTGYKRISSAEREVLMMQGYHFGLWRRQGEYTFFVPIYDEKDKNIVKLRFWINPNQVQNLLDYFQKLLIESDHLSTFVPRSKYKKTWVD